MILSSYVAGGFSRAYRREALKSFARMAREVEFDTVVATGTSGLLFGPLMAHHCHKNLVVVRKENDGSHSSRLVEGWTDVRRLVWVDDFVSSGRTAARVHEHLTDGLPPGWSWAAAFFWNSWLHHPSTMPKTALAQWLQFIPTWHFRACNDIGNATIQEAKTVFVPALPRPAAEPQPLAA